MSQNADSPQAVAADLLRWVRQNQRFGVESYFDEGEVQTQAVLSLPDVAVAPDPAGAPVTQPTPTAPPKPAPPPESGFDAMCRRFVAETVSLVRQQQPRPPQGPPLPATDTWEQLQTEVRTCAACDLSASRTRTVFGTGNPQADVVFIGEAPGQEEDRQGEPFVGASGQLLDKILAAIGWSRDDVYICNILKCRPPQNRDPAPVEVARCELFLRRQLDLLRPRVICCLGRVAAQTLLKSDLSLGRLRGSVFFYEGIPVMSTFHPAALLRNPAWKRDTWEDIRKLKALSVALSAPDEGSIQQ